jgi:hypothetical protein
MASAIVTLLPAALITVPSLIVIVVRLAGS